MPVSRTSGAGCTFPGRVDQLIFAGQAADPVVIVVMVADDAHVRGDPALGVIVELPIGIKGDNGAFFGSNGEEGMPPVFQQHGLRSFLVLQMDVEQLAAQRGQRFPLPQKGGAGLVKGFEFSGSYRPKPQGPVQLHGLDGQRRGMQQQQAAQRIGGKGPPPAGKAGSSRGR